MTQARWKRVLFGAAGAVLLLALVFLGVLMTSPTSAPKQYQMDFLAVYGAAREAAESSGPYGLSQEAVGKAKTSSGGLIEGMRVTRAGEIEVDANIVPRVLAGATGQRVPVKIRLVQTPDSNGSIDWKCLGRPVSALPSFCSEL